MNGGTGKGAYQLDGMRFGRLTVKCRASSPNGTRNSYWYCVCDCGNTTITKGISLVSGKTKSCGCYIRDITAQRNRDNANGRYRNERLYRIYYGMKTRCYNETEEAYIRYGKRGISICDEWKNDFFKFQEWALSTGYQDDLTIDRINNDGDYEPSNCRWADAKTQSNNRRGVRLISYNGDTHTVSEWSDILGFPKSILYSRLSNGWSVDDAFTVPKGKYIGGKYNHLSKLIKGEK